LPPTGEIHLTILRKLLSRPLCRLLPAYCELVRVSPPPGRPVAAPATAPIPFRGSSLSVSSPPLPPAAPNHQRRRPPTGPDGPPWLTGRPPGSPPLWRTVPASVPQSPRPHRREAPALARAVTPVCPTPTAYCASPSASAADSLAGSGPDRLYTYSPATL
jgi:hypothetical protein